MMSISEKYIFLSKIQVTLNNANDVLKNIEDESNRIEQENKENKENKEKMDNKGDDDEECPVCYEKLSNLCKVVPVCGHVICLRCYSNLSRKTCVQCRLFY